MKVYVDTSAFLAVLNAGDDNHPKASEIWFQLLDGKVKLYTNSFVLVETYALVQNRLGLDAVRTFTRDIYPLLTVTWVQGDLFTESIIAFLSANRRNLSLVDCASFTTMLRLGLDRVFTLDKHFAEQGFQVMGF